MSPRAQKASVVRYETPAKVVRERKQVVVDRRLDELMAIHGTITTDIVLDDSRDPSSPLHRYVDWDDGAAAEKWRRQQVLEMIMASKFVVVLNQKAAPPTVLAGERPEVRRLVSAFRGEGFTMRPDALSDAEKRKAIIARKLGVLRSWCREAVDIDELKEVREALEPFL